ncbi:MAG: DUF6398 domain-containing protein [Desulfoplanes sp.]
MASKGALKKKKALERRLKKHPLKISTITDLGEYLQEFLLRGVYIFSLKQGQNAIKTITASIHALLQDKQYNKIAALLGINKIPREQAQILAYQAMASPDPKKADILIKQALRLDSKNVDALAWQAKQILSTNPDHADMALNAMREITSFAEAQLGPQLDILNGKIHEFPLARPYLRSLYTLFSSLDRCELHEEALNVGKKILTLCGPDIFAIRDRMTTLQNPVQPLIAAPSQPNSATKSATITSPTTNEDENYGGQLNEHQAIVFAEICNKTDAFCQAHVDARIARYARRAAFQLCREDDMGAQRGKRESWASGIIYALAQANDLFVPDAHPAIQPVTIHTFFKISSSTTSKKSALLRKRLKISPDNPDWICHGHPTP